MITDFTFRYYVKEDFDKLLKIVIEFSYHLKRGTERKPGFNKEQFEKDEQKYLRSNSANKNYRFYICSKKGKFIGFIFFGKQDNDKTKGFVGELYVKPIHRGKGIATTLLSEAKRWISDQQCSEVEIDVFTQDKEAMQLYEKPGYKKQKHFFVTYIKRL